MLSLGRFSAVALLTVLSMSNFYAASASDTPKDGADIDIEGSVVQKKGPPVIAKNDKAEKEKAAAKKKAASLLAKEETADGAANGDGKKNVPDAPADVPAASDDPQHAPATAPQTTKEAPPAPKVAAAPANVATNPSSGKQLRKQQDSAGESGWKTVGIAILAVVLAALGVFAFIGLLQLLLMTPI